MPKRSIVILFTLLGWCLTGFAHKIHLEGDWSMGLMVASMMAGFCLWLFWRSNSRIHHALAMVIASVLLGCSLWFAQSFLFIYPPAHRFTAAELELAVIFAAPGIGAATVIFLLGPMRNQPLSDQDQASQSQMKTTWKERAWKRKERYWTRISLFLVIVVALEAIFIEHRRVLQLTQAITSALGIVIACITMLGFVSQRIDMQESMRDE
jgi:hypothetical protein